VLYLGINLHCRVDDIQDNSSLRRGIPAAHTVYGLPSTINAANYLFLISLKKAQDINYPEAMRLCTEQYLKCYQGQGMEIYWRDNYTCPTVEEYEDIAKKSKYGVKTKSRFQVYLGTYNKRNFLYLRDLKRFTHAFFPLWHPECSQQFQLPCLEILH
jgi:geranylgeranyl diphosphate synthase type 3